MRNLFFLLCIAAGLPLFAQDREYPDYRSKKDGFTRITEKDVRSDLASFAIGGMDESIGKGKLQSIPAVRTGSDFISFAGNNIQVTINAGFFDPSKHKLNFYNKEHLVKIDNKPYYGDYGEVPKTIIQSIIVLIDGDTVKIPEAAYGDIYNPEFSYRDASGIPKSFNNVYLSADKKTIYIYMLNRASKGGYEVTWVIRDKTYMRRVIDFNILK